MRTVVGAMALLMLAACGRPPAVEDGRMPDADRARLATAAGEGGHASTPPRRSVPSRSFAGIWTGPEGLSFVVEPQAGDRYHVRNRDTLDEALAFDAVQDGETLRFVRRGKTFVARPGTGAETGFKWLMQKQDCLIVQPGIEGYCRD